MRKYLILLLALTALITGCATSYQPSSWSGGYSDNMLTPNVAVVAISGNAYTTGQRAFQMLLLRCAELTLQHGYRYFAADSWADQSTNSGFTMPGSVSTTWGHGYASSIVMPPTYIPMYKPAGMVTISMAKTQKELVGHAGRILDAAYIQASMHSVLNLKG